jgi:hypothetical protein
MDSPVLFQKKFAWSNNWGRAIGFDSSHLLVLDRNKETDDWEFREVPSTEVREIQVRRYRSLYILILAIGAAVIALFVAYLGVTGERIGLSTFTVPTFLAVFSYLAFTESERLQIDFDTDSGSLRFKSWPGSFDETLATLPKLQQWADGHRITMILAFRIASAVEAHPERT